MKPNFVTVNHLDFQAGGAKIFFRGIGLGNWLNLEHFMIGLPGAERQLQRAVVESYGVENAARFWETYRNIYINEADFKFMKSLGINTIRIPFNYRLFEDDAAPYQYHETGFFHLDRALGLCEKYQIYAILDLHAVPGGQNPDWHSDNPYGENLFWAFPDLWKRVNSLWRLIARRYRDNPWVAAYDLINEPVLNGYPADRLDRFYNELIPQIREVDPNHLLFVEGDIYARDFTMLRPPDDPNLAYSFHFYPFFEEKKFSQTGTLGEKIERAVFENITIEDIRGRLRRPVWCGETGIPVAWENAGHLWDILADTLSVYEKHNVSWSLWSYKDARGMGMVTPKENSPWMDFSRRACRDWAFWGEMDQVTGQVEKYIAGFNVPITGKLTHKLLFRFLADKMLVMTDTYRDLFSRIPFTELLAYLESFRFENCEVNGAIAAIVRKFTGM